MCSRGSADKDFVGESRLISLAKKQKTKRTNKLIYKVEVVLIPPHPLFVWMLLEILSFSY